VRGKIIDHIHDATMIWNQLEITEIKKVKICLKNDDVDMLGQNIDSNERT
jgi:hypothetical protein